MKLEPLLDGLSFGEGPRWRDDRLYFSDFYVHQVRTVDESGTSETIVEVPGQPSGLGWRADGTMLIVSMTDRRLMRFAGGKLTVEAELGGIATGLCNDMIVDPDGSVHAAANELMFPNGSVITPDGKTMIIAETFAKRLTAFDLAEDGTLSNRRVWAETPNCNPDGICLDAEGAVWVTGAFTHHMIRVFEGGRVTHDLDLGERAAYACMLGGTDRRTLFVVTNSGSGPAIADKKDGRIETMRVDVPGAGLP